MEITEAILNKLVTYDAELGKVVWSERDASCYPHAVTQAKATQTANLFNLHHAGKPIPISGIKGSRFVKLRSLDENAVISADRLLWFAISGILVTDKAVHYLDGDVMNHSLDNVVLTSVMAKGVMLDKTVGITPYVSDGKQLYSAEVGKNKYTPRTSKRGFTSIDDATLWRTKFLKLHGQWWRIPATTAYKDSHEAEAIGDRQ